VQAGPARICIECAGATLEHIANRSCPVCDQFLDGNCNCPNWLCTDPGRRIKKISAIAYSSGSLRNKIISYKYDGVTGWSLIFARLLIGWLQRNAGDDPPSIIVANPTYVEPMAGQIGHTERVLQAAEREDALGRWPLDAGDPAVLIKAEPTTHSAGSSAAAKRAAASDLRRTLRITDRSQIVDRDVLVYDDVCTTGSQHDGIMCPAVAMPLKAPPGLRRSGLCQSTERCRHRMRGGRRQSVQAIA
jgi:predicted amidophosphoribosyltransferase